jgi:hypothetical protein
MSKSFNKILVIVLVIMLILVFWKWFEDNRTYNKISLQTNNLIHNQSPFEYADTVLSVALQIAKVDGVSVIIKELTPDIRNRFEEENAGIELNAAVIGRGSQYIVYVHGLTHRDALIVMAHETIHIIQYRSGRLQILSPKSILWETDTLTSHNVQNMPYVDRPWEREAFDGESGLASKMEQILYGKNM